MVYPAIYCWISNVITNVTFHWLTSGFTSLTMLDFGKHENSLNGKTVNKCIRMGITNFTMGITNFTMGLTLQWG